MIKKQDAPNAGFELVDIAASPDRIGTYGAAAVEEAGSLGSLAVDQPVDRIGPGDVVQITIFEIGTRLFGPATAADAASPTGTNIDAQGRALGDMVVQPDGTISLPYVGKLKVADLTVQDIERQIVSSLRGKSQFPQAMVTVRQNLTNTVVISGEVEKPGRYPLSAARERLLEALAGAGWSKIAPNDVIVRFTRAGRTVEQRLSAIADGSGDNLLLNPGDRIEIVKRPRTYVVLGATDKVTQMPFDAEAVSLAEAVARAGGPDDGKANPAAVFLFRFVPPTEPGGKETPVVFRLDMLNPSSYLLSQKFALRDKDVIYFATAATNQPSKLAQIINQLFTPLILARSLGQ